MTTPQPPPPPPPGPPERWPEVAPPSPVTLAGGDVAVGGEPGGWAMFSVFVAAELTFVLVSLIALVPFALADPGIAHGPLPGPALLVALAVPPALAAVVAVGGTRLFGGGAPVGRLRRELAASWNWRDIGIGLAFGGGGLLLTVPASAAWARWVGEEDANSAVGEVIDGRALSPMIAVAVFFVIWLVAPLCEELLFRGVLWRALERWRWNRWLIVVVTTLAFAFLHFELLRTPLLVVISIPVALARLLTGNLAASVVAHQTNNFLPAVGLLLLTLGVAPP